MQQMQTLQSQLDPAAQRLDTQLEIEDAQVAEASPAERRYAFPMLTISADQMQKALPDYLKLVEAGETLVITRADESVAQVNRVAPVAREPRPFGLCAGEFRVPDDFDAPLPAESLDAFLS